MTALPVASPKQVRTYARTLLHAYPGRFAAAVVLNVAAALAALAFPNLLGHMTDLIAAHVVGDGIADDLEDRLDGLTVAVAVALLLQTALAWQAARTTYALGERVLARVREDFLACVVELPLSTVERAGTGDLLARTTLDAEEVNLTVREAVPQFFVNLVTMAVLLVGALWVSPVLTATVLVAVPVLVPVLRWYLRRAPAAFAALQARLADLTASVAETADGARTVEVMGWQRRRIARTEHEIARTWAAQRRTLTLRSVIFPALDVTALLPCLTTLVAGGVLVMHDRATVGEVTTVVLLMQMLSTPVIELVRSLEWLEEGAASLARLFGVGTVPPDGHPVASTPRQDSPSVIQLSGVRFGYTSEREVLHNVDLAVRRGERLALVGPTGAGKSTLARIIAGIHPPASGTATVAGVPLTGLRPDQLRSLVMLTTQEHHVFAGTLADNVRMVAPDATDQELKRALGLVGASQWVETLPDGLGTDVGMHHTVLTPAQVQQIALARLVLASPDVVVLDEATSMMSPQGARSVEAALNRALAGRTVVVIAHRLHTAENADRIAVVQDGRITELGVHAELLARGGTYSHLWSLWHGDGTGEA